VSALLIHNRKIALSLIHLGRCPSAPMTLAVLLLFYAASAAATNVEDLPLPVRVVLLKINPLLVEKKYDRAIEKLLKFQARGKPAFTPGQKDRKGYHHPEIYYTLGNCYLLKGKYTLAAHAFEKAVKGDDTHTHAWLNLAKACYEQEQYLEAAHAFKKGYTTAKAKNPEHLYFSAAAYFSAAKYLRSIQIFKTLLSVHPKAVKPKWREHLVYAFLAADQRLKALPHIHILIRAFCGKKEIQWQEILLQQYIQLNMQTEALAYAKGLARNTPTLAKWWKALAHIQLNQSRLEEALAALTIYSFLSPLSLEEKKLLADLNLQLGIPVKAAPVYENYLKRKPDKELLQHLIVAYRQLGKPEKAIECLDRFDAVKNDPELILIKGELLYTLKKYDQAAVFYRKAAGKKGKHVGQAWLMAGYAAWQINDISASKKAFAKAAKYKKEKKAATTVLKQLISLPADNPN
jgi:tetratricopeptide (TPR) repeat protein